MMVTFKAITHTRDNDTSVQPQPREAGTRNGGGSVRTTERCNSYEDGQPPSAG